MIDWYLEAENGDADLIQIVELKDIRSYSVGRKRDFDIISLNPLVSRTHGLFKHKVNNRIYVYDSNSSNGIWVNDEKITAGHDYLLNENDLIGIGAPSSAQEARLELFRLRGTHLTADAVDIPELKLKEESKDTAAKPSTVSNLDSSLDNVKLPSTSPNVSNSKDNDLRQPHGPNKVEKVTSQDTNGTSSCRNATTIRAGEVKIENTLIADKKHRIDVALETPTHSEHNGEHVFSFPEAESEQVIPKYEHCAKNSASRTHDIINVDEEPCEERIFQDTTRRVEQIEACKQRIPVVRLDRLEFVPKTVQAKKKFEVISSSSDEEEDVDDTKHKHVSNQKYREKISPKRTSNVPSGKHRDTSDKDSKHSRISKTKPKRTESRSREKSKRTASLFEKLFGESESAEIQVETAACKERKCSTTSTSSSDKSRTKPGEKTASKERKISSTSTSSSDKSRGKHVEKTERKMSSNNSSSAEKSKGKHVEKTASKERKISSTSSSSTEKSKRKNVEKTASKGRKMSSNSSSSTEKSKGKHVEKTAGKERKLSSTSSSSTEKLISFLTSASKLNSTKPSASNTFIYSSSSEDEPVRSKRSKSSEKQQVEPATSRRVSGSSDDSDKSARMGGITKKSTTHSTEKPASRTDEIRLKTEIADHISLDSKTSGTSQENVAAAKDLVAEGRNLQLVKSEKLLPTVQDLQEASTSKAVPSVEEIRTIKQEIFDEREANAERQTSPIMFASHVSISSDSDPPSPVPKEPTEVDNSSFSMSCDIGEIICLSDDDDIFPKSQMFEDDVRVKDEPLTCNDNEDITVKAEQQSQHEECAEEYPTPEHDDNVFGIIKKDVEFDDDAILIDDDDDNEEVDSLWYSRLSQPGYSSSQLEDPQEVYDDKNVNRTGQKVLKFLDDNDLITSKQVDELADEGVDFGNESSENEEMQQDEGDLIDDSVPICVVIHSYQPGRAAVVQEPAAVDELDTTSKLDEIKSKIATKKSFALPPVIDAPHLIKGRRKTTEEIKPKGQNKRGRKRKQSVDERATSAAVPAPVRTFGTGTNLDKSVVNELHKRHKRRRHSTDTLPPDKKLEIREERMKKLKKIAQKPAEDKKQDDKPKNTSKPYIKLSSSRGLFLTDKETEKRRIRVKTPSELELEPRSKKKFVIPKKKVEETGRAVEEAVASTSKENTAVTPQIPNTVIEEDNPSAIAEESVKKRVTFNDKPEIRVYIIDDGNHMNKCTSKDAPLPRKVIQTVPAIRVADDLPENIALCDILSWVPIWLEEQKHINAAPKLSQHKPIQMLHTFNTHGDYCNIVIPLLLLELWRSVFRDWVNSRKPVLMARIDDVQPMHMCRVDMLQLHCHSVITRHDSEHCLHPVRGDLLVIEILLEDTNRQCSVIKKLGYVVDITKRRLNAHDLISTKLVHTAVIPEFLVHYKVMLKDFNTEINRDHMIRIRAISRVGTSLRIFKSVSLLNQSALCKFILNPQVNDYKVPKLTKTKLVISDKLDTDQVKCMIEACQICVRPEPGIYMVQGPPGTGKSRLIKNIVHQLIYAERKSGTKPNCILLCAPSNGAIDQLARKLLEMRQSLPHDKRFRMVRLGPPNSIHPKVKPVSLPCLVEAYVQKQLNFKRETNDAVLDDLHFRQSKINMLQNKLVSLRERKLNAADVEIQLQKAKNDLELFHNRSKKEMTYHERKALERTSEETVITKADIVCSTLSSCVASRMEEMYRRKLLHFTCCIIDEATQSSEQETLIPLTLGINKLVLVGDPAQLPATVLSQEAKQLGYGNSLFYRIQKCFEHLPENPIRMLKTQYRMHPEICKFPNEHFYDAKLINSSDNRDANTGCTLRHRYRVFALRTSQQDGAHAYLNVPEAEFVLALCKLVTARTDYSVGVITPYTKQREYLQRGLEQITKDRQTDRVTVNTVDGFQGQERDVIIVSCVRHTSNVFLADQQRLNVSLTRAKHALYICANVELFKNDDIWTTLEQDATKRKCLTYLTKTDYENEKYVMSLLYESR